MKWYEIYIGLPLLIGWFVFVYMMIERKHLAFTGRVRTGNCWR
jgi:hypothetical protein